MARMKPANGALEDAFVVLQQSLRSYLRRRLPDAAQVDDVLQDVFVKAIVSQQAGRSIENLSGWLYAAARTGVADYFRHRGVATDALDEDLAISADADGLQLHTDLSSCLRAFIDQLPPHYRETLLATELEGRPLRALAQEQGVSVSAIKSQAARGRHMLKARLLACCHVEMKDGLVSDYHRRSSDDCDEGCA
ncbi:MAG: sigma-70 family RNA polymerase sigma factor [Denitromonas halophila]|nr:MAG: sigma-70 family RNA polymerase sigma factor [Denitromonas halophila]